MRRIFLVGMGPTALSALESLLDRFEVVGLSRSAPEGADAVLDLAKGRGVPLFSDLSVAAVAEAIQRAAPDCVVVSSYHRVLPAKLVAERPFVNVHYAPLPRYRGRANVNWAIINGDPGTAITIHRLAPELDGGNILLQSEIAIGPEDSVADLYQRLNALQRQHLGETVERFLDGAAGTPQDERRATYGCTRLPRDGMIDWTRPAAQVAALVRALAPPYPGAFTHLDGRKLIVWKAAVPDDAPRYEGRIPGRPVRIARGEGFVDVLCGDATLRLHEVQRPGGSRVPAAEVLKSVKLTLGLSTEDLLTRIEELERQLASRKV